ncbi:MAG: energy transducer TonB [Rhodospirillales bacterium]|nr:energy transducer TonB [Rhodospirillales bacterium]
MQRGSLIFSAIFHVAVLAFVFIGLPQLFERKPLEDTPIAVQLVTLADETHATQLTKTPPKPNAKPEPQVAQATPEPPKPEPPKPEPPKQAPPPPPPPPPPPKPPEPQPEPKPTPAPPEPPKEAPPPPPEPKAELPKPEPKPEQKPEPAKPVVEAPKPKAKPEPPKQVAKADSKETQKQQESDFSSLLKNLTKQKTAPSPEDATPKSKAQPAQQQASSQPMNAPLGSQLTVSEKDLVIQQIQQCWNVPAGAKDAQNLIIDVHIDVASDRTVTNVQIVDQSRYNSDPFFRAAADSAKRAVLNPRCSPLKLPADKFDQWKSITLSFNPKDVT